MCVQCQTPPAAVNLSSIGHLCVSTLTSILASHLLWSLWGVIQSASATHSTGATPSWAWMQHTGSSFPVPPIGFLEYAEMRMELYSKMKQLWMQLHHATPQELYGPPPAWQAMTSD